VSVSLLRPLVRGLAALLRPRRADTDLEDEVRHYLDQAAAAHVARGLSPEKARRAAALEVGGATAVREQVRSSRWEHALESMLQDGRYALRRLRKDPAFTLTAVVTLALGIGASTAVFSAVSPILLEPLPFPHARRLVTVDDRNVGGVPMPATLGSYEELEARTHVFEALAAADRWQPSLTGTGDPERLDGERVTAGYFGVFGAVPIVGRDFTPTEDRPGAPNVVIVSAGFAERRFGGARRVVNQQIELNGDPYLVIGVMPHEFTNVLAPAADIWSPLRERATPDFNSREWGHHYQLVARLAATATFESATREILAVGRARIPDFPRPAWADLSQGLLVRPLQEAVTGNARPALFAIVAAVLLLLAIASVNVANLLLARGALRRAELTMRVALGAGRRRLLRQLLTESVTLALLGGMLGLGVAQFGVRALVAMSPPGLPRVDAIRLDARVFVFAVLLTTLVGVLVGLSPALAALRVDGTKGLPHESHRTTAPRSKARSVLVVAEVALALVLLVSAGLLFRSVRLLVAVAPGFDPAHVVTMQVVEAGHAFDADAARLGFWEPALDAVRRVPGVTSAAFTSQLPLSGEVDGYGYEQQSAPSAVAGENGSALRYAVTPDYFVTMRIPLLRGRLLATTDRPGAPEAVVINQRFARRLFGDQDPIGQRVRFGPEMGNDRPWDEVVGVVGDVKHYSLAVGAPNAFYVVNGQWDWVDNVETLVVRATGPAAALVPSLARAVRSVNANVPILRVETMDGYVAASAGNRRFALLAIETFALAALGLAAVGLYGVVSGSVTERIREIGIRTALGATPSDVVAEVVRRSLALTLAGAALGVGGAVAASRLLTSMLFEVTALDPVTYAAVLCLMVGVALVAAWAPARRAVGVDPTVALRAE
jgi:putative ABC transport system permease protein